ncbi:MFS transporter [Endozoicomonas sp. 8E]|uniref:MFS transporter n=1 Tax=Endozoicomonas sp. 8E TaxID=3035692 RepID=UPI002938EC8A|nr:MFS transporter [Endozoicomonas sp. 8E]WOG25572.1 MFS transporter [Endozoicomonas sp. 8E]
MALSQKKVVAITSMGGLLEAFDFTVYAYMVVYISQVFFPASGTTSSLINTFITFAFGYISRPIGAIAFSHWGDRHSRKSSFTVTILLMAISTLLIGLLPGYAQWGLLAPLLLAVLRFLQGFSFAGELCGAFIYLYETVPAQSKGFAVSILSATTMTGTLLGIGLQGVLVYLLTVEQMIDWGWRVPFILGGSLGAVSYVVRRHFVEPEAFRLLLARGAAERVPVRTLLKQYKSKIFTGFLLVMPVLVSVTILVLFMPGYLTGLLDYSAREVAVANGISMFVGVSVCLLTGWLADRLDRRYLMLGSSFLIVVTAWPLFHWYASGDANLAVTALIGAILWGSIDAISFLLLVSAFPVSIRFTGVALVYNIAAMIFAGFGPVISMGLIRVTQLQAAPAFYLMVAGVAGCLGAMLISPEQRRNHASLSEELEPKA